MRRSIRTFFLFLLLLFAAAGAQAVTLSDLFNGGAITAGDKLFDNWSLDFYDSGDLRDFNGDNIDVTPLHDGGNDPGPGLEFSVLNNELSVTGDGIFNYVDLQLSFRASVLAPGLLIKDNSLEFTGGVLTNQADQLNDLGVYINETVGTGTGLDDLGFKEVEFSILDDVLFSQLLDSAVFTPQNEVWVTKNILVWAVDETDSAILTSFEQRFSQTVVPEPSTIVLLGLGLVGAVAVRWRSRKS
jgi:hypothetical protein